VDDGAVFFLNGQEIHRTNVTGTATSATLADQPIEYPPLSERIAVPGTSLVWGENVLAVSLHQASPADADAFFFATLDIQETPPPPGVPAVVRFSELGGLVPGPFFLELANESGSGPQSLEGWTVATSGGATHGFGATDALASGERRAWDSAELGFVPQDGDRLFLYSAAGTIADAVVVKNRPEARDAEGAWLRPSLPSPGGPNSFALNPDVVIHEIMYHRAPQYLPSGTIDHPEEWIEVFNRGNAPVDLTGWRLGGGCSYDFPPGTTLPAGGYLVVASDPVALLAAHPHLTVGTTLVGPLSGTLSNQGDLVILEDANGNPVDQVRYHDGGRWDSRADGGGSSLELRNAHADNALPESWTASDESNHSTWQTFTHTGTAASFPGSSEPNLYHELIFGLNGEGEFLLDDVTLTEAEAGSRECIQNGTFASGADTWRRLGNHGLHGQTVVTPDPDDAGNPVLRVVAAGPQGHMQDHLETTLKAGGSYVTINPANTYTLTFRARWVSV
jgi:Lamin Tail Domain